jgi:hypothetical protein
MLRGAIEVLTFSNYQRCCESVPSAMNGFNFKGLFFEIKKLCSQTTDQDFKTDFVKGRLAGFATQLIDEVVVGAMTQRLGECFECHCFFRG